MRIHLTGSILYCTSPLDKAANLLTYIELLGRREGQEEVLQCRILCAGPAIYLRVTGHRREGGVYDWTGEDRIYPASITRSTAPGTLLAIDL